MKVMILDTIRKKIEKSGKSRYQMAKELAGKSGSHGKIESQLCKIMHGKTVVCETADLMLEYFGLELTEKKTKMKKR